MVAVVTGAAGFIGRHSWRDARPARARARYRPRADARRRPGSPTAGRRRPARRRTATVHAALHRRRRRLPPRRLPERARPAGRTSTRGGTGTTCWPPPPCWPRSRRRPRCWSPRRRRSTAAPCVGRPSAETDPLRPRGGYARSKVLVEQLCAARRRPAGWPRCVRPFTVAGEGQRPAWRCPAGSRRPARGRRCTCSARPHRTRDITDVRQVVRALIELAGAALVAGVVNLGTGVGRTLGELVDAVGRARRRGGSRCGPRRRRASRCRTRWPTRRCCASSSAGCPSPTSTTWSPGRSPTRNRCARHSLTVRAAPSAVALVGDDRVPRLGIGVRALYGAHVAVDEQQYLLTAISLAEDGNLDITDELAEQRWRAFADVAPPSRPRCLRTAGRSARTTRCCRCCWPRRPGSAGASAPRC